MFDHEPAAQRSILVAIFLVVAFPVHEFAHAWAAYLQGDATAKLFGRLTLNPVVHFDPLGGADDGALGPARRAPVRLGEADAGQHRQPPGPAQRRGDRRARGPGVEPGDGGDRRVSCSGCSLAIGVSDSPVPGRAAASTTSSSST